MMKRCFRCGEIKPLSEFYRHAMMADGHLNKCIECARNDAKVRSRTNPYVQEYERRRSKNPERMAVNSARAKEWFAQHQQARRAMTALHNAVRDGRIKKQPCEKCGSTDNIYGVHYDYSAPLVVVWLCALCHRRDLADHPEKRANRHG